MAFRKNKSLRSAVFFCLITFMVSVPASSFSAQKAGVGVWENSHFTILEWIEETSDLGWYYNWRPNQIHTRTAGDRSIEFVPMIHSERNVSDLIQSDLTVNSLLGFNEPDGHGGGHQAALSVDRAIALWPDLERHNLRLGSPATTQSGTLGENSWQRRFMDEIERRGMRVDFMAVHYYSKTGNVSEFEDWLHRVHAAYRRPIWVTEFAYIDWSDPQSASYEQNARFASAAILMMQSLPFVERHAWFAANPYPWEGLTPKINLIDDRLKETPVGTSFKNTLQRLR